MQNVKHTSTRSLATLPGGAPITLDRLQHPLRGIRTPTAFGKCQPARGPLQRQNILRPGGLIRPVFSLQQHGAALQRLQAVPLPGRDIQYRPARNHIDRLRQRTAVILEVLLEMPPHTDTRLRRETMTMDWHRRPRLNGVQHPLGLVLRRIPQIQVAPQTWIRFRQLSQIIEYLLINYHNLTLMRPTLPGGTVPSHHLEPPPFGEIRTHALPREMRTALRGMWIQ